MNGAFVPKSKQPRQSGESRTRTRPRQSPSRPFGYDQVWRGVMVTRRFFVLEQSLLIHSRAGVRVAHRRVVDIHPVDLAGDWNAKMLSSVVHDGALRGVSLLAIVAS